MLDTTYIQSILYKTDKSHSTYYVIGHTILVSQYGASAVFVAVVWLPCYQGPRQ